MASKLPPAPKLTAEALGAATGSNRPRSDSHSSHSSGDSHSSHSSHQERQRLQHLGEAPGGPPSVVKPVAKAIVILLILFVGQAFGLWLFTKGFLLTRTSLEGVSTCSRAPQSTFSLPSKLQKVYPKSEEEFQLWQDVLTNEAECTLPKTYDRSLIWIIDALRYDFLADIDQREQSEKDSWTPSPYYHNVLNLPSRLNKLQNSFSFLSHFLADAPTTTLQRLKGLTTGSLPTFIDAGSNFGGSEITEDNWLSQMRSAALSKGSNITKMGIAGDDTWLTVFPSMFDEQWRFPFDSFNVEDLDGVDRGVEEKLKPFLDGKNASLTDWHLLVAHTLGVDHVGHRLGASHPRMKSKLEEMEHFLEFIVSNLPEDALFILLGDHGMDDKGDHGGDGELEVGAALWMYSKRKQNKSLSKEAIDTLHVKADPLVQSYQTFSMLPSPPFAAEGHRSVPQIDLVPTLSLLLGQPIPFNNLGSVIPEAFESSSMLVRALRINALQIQKYLDEYAKASNDLKPFQEELRSALHQALQKDADLGKTGRKNLERLEIETAQAYLYFNRLALVRARSIWAKFEGIKMILGLTILALSVILLIRIKHVATKGQVEDIFGAVIKAAQPGALVGAALGAIGKLSSLYVSPLQIFRSLEIWECTLLGLILGVQITLILGLRSPDQNHGKKIGSDWSLIGVLLPISHSIAFSSNSFTVHEDKIVLALTIIVFLYRGFQGYLNSPLKRLKVRIPLLAVSCAIAIRIISASRVCREEQAPNCTSTFYSQTESTINSPIVILLAYGLALGMPSLIKYSLSISRSDGGVAPLFFGWILRPSLLAGAGYWLLDWLVTADVFGSNEENTASAAHSIVETAKVALARSVLGLVCVIALAFWIFSPLCLEMKQEAIPAPAQSDDKTPATRVIVLGFANSFGSSYLIFLSLVFALLFLVAQPLGQVVLSLIMITIVACAEIGDHERDGEILQGLQKAQQKALKRTLKKQAKAGQQSSTSNAPPIIAAMPALALSMTEISTLALVGFMAFFSTGHQATFASIQWRTAFVGFRTVQYPFSPLLVVLNSFGPLAFLPSIALPLLVLWNLAPQPRSGPKQQANEGNEEGDTKVEDKRMPTVMHILQASLSFLFYHLLITLATAIFAAHFRRHLMLFKIWTPRFMMGAISLQIVFLGLILGFVAAGNVMNKVAITFGSAF